MKISKIKIKNYRWIREQELNFDKYNTLVWKNDCWKSTIINAIKLFFNNEKVSEKDFNCYINPRENIEIYVEVSDFPKELMKNFLLNWEKEDGIEDVLMDYLHDNVLRLTRVWEYRKGTETDSKSIFIHIKDFISEPIYWLKSADLKRIETRLGIVIPPNQAWNNSDIERKAFIRKKLLEDNINQEDRKLEQKFSDIKNILPIIELLKADQSIETTTTEFKWTFTNDVKNIIKEERENGSESTLSWIESKIAQKISQEAEIIKKCMQEHLSDLEELRIKPTFSWEKWVEITNVDIKLKSDDDYIPLENKWSWYRRLFMVWRLRYLADKKEAQNIIYLVEEPETFLHPSAQEEMLNSLISLSENNQVFLTSHSPIFVWATKPNAITLCKRNSTKLEYSQDWERDDNFLINIAKELWVKPIHDISDSYRAIVFVEWSNDAKFLKIASEKLWKNFHNLVNSQKIAIIDGWWQSLDNFINIKFFEQQGKKMFLITDSDIFDPQQIDSKKISSLQNKYNENQKRIQEFENKDNTQWFLLKKKCIDTYYHPRAIERKLWLAQRFIQHDVFPDNFCTETYLQILKNTNSNLQIRKKNWIELFKFMEPEEWKEVSNWELERIFDEIEKSVEKSVN